MRVDYWEDVRKTRRNPWVDFCLFLESC